MIPGTTTFTILHHDEPSFSPQFTIIYPSLPFSHHAQNSHGRHGRSACLEDLQCFPPAVPVFAGGDGRVEALVDPQAEGGRARVMAAIHGIQERVWWAVVNRGERCGKRNHFEGVEDELATSGDSETDFGRYAAHEREHWWTWTLVNIGGPC